MATDESDRIDEILRKLGQPDKAFLLKYIKQSNGAAMRQGFRAGREAGFAEASAEIKRQINAINVRPTPMHDATPADTPVDNLGLPTRIANLLMREGIWELGKLASASTEAITELPDLGIKGCLEIQKALGRHGYPRTDLV